MAIGMIVLFPLALAIGLVFWAIFAAITLVAAVFCGPMFLVRDCTNCDYGLLFLISFPILMAFSVILAVGTMVVLLFVGITAYFSAVCWLLCTH